MNLTRTCFLASSLMATAGCAVGTHLVESWRPNRLSEAPVAIACPAASGGAAASPGSNSSIVPCSFENADPIRAGTSLSPSTPAAPPPVIWEIGWESPRDSSVIGQPEEVTPPDVPLGLSDVLRSVYAGYPLLRVAVEQRTIADGQQLEASGAFDFKVKAGGTSGPLGFYQTHRYGAGFEQALLGGSDLVAGYRIGRGNFQPWYGERETDDAGEFKAGILIPLGQNRAIDERRAQLFRSTLGRDAVEPDILLQLIEFVRGASYAYWDWYAAGQVVQVERAVLEIALKRQVGLQTRVDQGDIPRIDLVDNERLIVSRQASLIDAERKSRQATIKLSLFFRSPDGQPVLVSPQHLPREFPDALDYPDSQLEIDIQTALEARPETQYLGIFREQLEIDLAQARNQYLPEINVGATASKDIGAMASSKGDKTPLELEASLLVDVPLQRRKALGKLQATQGKLSQMEAKLQFTREKITVDVQSAVAGLKAAHSRITQARKSVELNKAMEDAERSRYDAGDSNLLTVNLREQASVEASKTLVAAQQEYFQAQADYRAALAMIPIPDEDL